MNIDELRAWHARVDSDIPFETWLALRFRAQTDLFWLATKVLGYDFTEECHRPVIDFYVKKNPNEPIHRQDTCKDRLQLDPRGTFKTTMIVCDCIQWIVCFPDIRIMDVTANDDLATATIGELKSKFILREDGQRTLFQTLFPEHLIRPQDVGPASEFTTAAREVMRKEPTVWALGITSTGSGWHCDLGKFDDCVSDKNSETSEQRRKVWNRMQLLRKLVDPFGYHDWTGTRYELDDAYGLEMENANPEKMKILVRAARTLKPESKYKAKDELCEADWDLLFPIDASGTPRLTYDFLENEERKDHRSYCSQYLNDPVQARSTKFTEEMLRRATVHYTMLPKRYQAFQVWDLAYSVEKNRAFTVGATGLFDSQSRIFAASLVKGRFPGSELGYQIAKAAQMWRPECVGIEDSPGARWLEPEIRRHAAILGIEIVIEWIRLAQSKNAKANRIWGLEPLLVDGRFFFSSACEFLDDCYSQFLKFTGPTFGGLIDIADALSHLPRYLPRVRVETVGDDLSVEMWELMRRKEMHDAIYGARLEPVAEPELVAPSLDDVELPPDVGNLQ